MMPHTRSVVRVAVWLAAVGLAAELAAGQSGSRQPPVSRATAPSAAPASAGERKVPFLPGETLTYDVSWSTFLTAGVATLTVKDKRPQPGGLAYYIVAEARPIGLVASLYRLYYKAETWLDSTALLPHRSTIYSEEGGQRRLRTTRFNHQAQKAEFELRTATTVTSSVALPRHTQDMLSALYVLRAIPLAANTRMTMPVCDGGRTFRVQLIIGGIEPVKVGSGQVPAYRIIPTVFDERGQRVGRPLTIWISSDPRRLPLRLQADLAVGNVNLTLRSS